MIRLFNTQTEDPRPFLSQRGVTFDSAISECVANTIEDVRRRGDEALLESARRFDAPDLTTLVASQAEVDEAMPLVDQSFALDHAIERVKAFHEAQLAAITAGWKKEDFQSPDERKQHGQPRHHVSNHRWTWNLTAEPEMLGQRLSPLEKVGAYVPGGNATYPSSVIMNVVPAQVAGVNQVVVTTPARKDGSLAPALLYAARYCGVARVVKVGGAAAVAALAIGTESVPKVDKVVGPGNRYVNEAKRQLWGSVGVDGYAGPSEVCVLVDDTSNAKFAAADFLTQIEHASDNAGFLVGTSERAVQAVLHEVENQLSGAAREETMKAAMQDHGAAIVCRDLSEACEIVNMIAPEHLSIAVKDSGSALARIENAGCILIGEWTPESAGDYVAGPSHTLPTATAARFGSPVNVFDFLKMQSLLRFERSSFDELASTIEAFGEMEGFPAHGRGATIRRDK
jgi:histidinol dehydrogenase